MSFFKNYKRIKLRGTMSFFKNYYRYKNDDNLVDKFLIHVGVLKRIAFLDKINIKTNHTIDSRECRAVGKTTFSYPEEIEHIYSILNLKHGLFKEEVFNNEDYPDVIRDVEHFHELEETINISLDNKVNECSLHLDDTKFDNYTKEFELTFDFRGELHDVDIIQEKNYYVYCDAIIANNESPYWCSLVVQAILFQKEKKYDTALLFLFSAFDNLITLEIEKLVNSFYKEFNLKNLEFGKKVSILLKHHLKVNPGENDEEHPVRSLIYKIYTELYELRNAVAHGKIRSIIVDHVDYCLDMLIFTYTTINSNPKDNFILLKKIKEL